MNYLTITSPDVNNGLGCRVTLWVAGCSHHCEGCHNQHTWRYNQGSPLYDAIEPLFNILDKPYIKGLTLSGGDPLAQSDESLKELLDLLLEFRQRYGDAKDIWIYSGDVYENIIQHPLKNEILELCDVLVDGEFKLRKLDLSLPFRGSSNQRIINLNETKNSGVITLLEM